MLAAAHVGQLAHGMHSVSGSKGRIASSTLTAYVVPLQRCTLGEMYMPLGHDAEHSWHRCVSLVLYPMHICPTMVCRQRSDHCCMHKRRCYGLTCIRPQMVHARQSSPVGEFTYEPWGLQRTGSMYLPSPHLLHCKHLAGSPGSRYLRGNRCLSSTEQFRVATSGSSRLKQLLGECQQRSPPVALAVAGVPVETRLARGALRALDVGVRKRLPGYVLARIALLTHRRALLRQRIVEGPFLHGSHAITHERVRVVTLSQAQKKTVAVVDRHGAQQPRTTFNSTETQKTLQ